MYCSQCSRFYLGPNSFQSSPASPEPALSNDQFLVQVRAHLLEKAEKDREGGVTDVPIDMEGADVDALGEPEVEETPIPRARRASPSEETAAAV